MSKKLSVDELLRQACIYAERDQEALVRAHDHMPDDPTRIEAEEFVKQLRAYRIKRWGKTALEAEMEEAREVSLADVVQRRHNKE